MIKKNVIGAITEPVSASARKSKLTEAGDVKVLNIIIRVKGHTDD